MSQLVGQVQRFGANSPQAEAALNNIRADLGKAGVGAVETKTLMQGLQSYIDSMHGTLITNTIVTDNIASYATVKGSSGLPGYAEGSPVPGVGGRTWPRANPSAWRGDSDTESQDSWLRRRRRFGAGW